MSELLGLHAVGVMVLASVGFFLFTRERIPLESSGLAVLTVLIVGFQVFPYSAEDGPVDPSRFLSGFGNSALITIVALLICSKALEVTGALQTPTRLLAALWETNPRTALLCTLFLAAFASMFINNTPQVAMMLPVLVAVCIRTGTPVTSVLMPVGFATTIGGMATTIGTSTNLLVTDLSARMGMPRFEMFDFALPVVIAGSASIVLLWLIGPRVLPQRASLLSDAAPRIFRGVLHITGSSTAAGHTLSELLAMTFGRMRVERIERGEGLFIARLPTTVLREGDRLYVSGQSHELKEYEALLGTPLWRPDRTVTCSAQQWMEEKTPQRLAEIVVTTASALYGQTIAQLILLEQYGLLLIAVHAPRSRDGDEFKGGRSERELILRTGDVLLVQGDASRIQDLKATGQLLVLDTAIDLPHTAKASVAMTIMIGVVAFAATDLMPILVSSLLGVVLCIATRAIQWRQLRAAIDTNLVVIIVTSLALGDALTLTGGAQWLASLFVDAAGDMPPGLVIALLMLAAAILTELVTNNAVALILTPIAFSIADGMAMDVKPLVLAVMFGASMGFLTPFGYQTNLMVMNAGGYRVTDFVRLGLPLQLFLLPLLSWLLASGIGSGL